MFKDKVLSDIPENTSALRFVREKKKLCGLKINK
jgi:hypothetical protein